MKKALVCGGGGFIGSHLVTDLKRRGYWVRAVDLERPRYAPSDADDFLVADLRDQGNCEQALAGHFDEVYQLAADMGGAGYLFTESHDADIMHNSMQINLNVVRLCAARRGLRVFYSSSACVYPQYNQVDPLNPQCTEDSTYPAAPDSCYGWEKLFSEMLYTAFHRNHGLDIRIGRLHNIFGEKGSWNNGKEKAPAAIARKVAEAADGATIEIWGPGTQTRSFLHIEECLEVIHRFMQGDFPGPINIGSEEMISINDLARMAIAISGKSLAIRNVHGPIGVMGRNSDNTLMRKMLGWSPSRPLEAGMRALYAWINEQVNSTTLRRDGSNG